MNPLAQKPKLSPPLPCVLACSGCSRAGELADHTARRLEELGVAKMSCLAGVGGRVNSILATLRSAPSLLMIDGCPLECGRSSLGLAGFTGFQHLKLHELGVRKHHSEVREETVAALAEAASILLCGGPTTATTGHLCQSGQR